MFWAKSAPMDPGCLCKAYYYNLNTFFNGWSLFLWSIYLVIDSSDPPPSRYFPPEILPTLKDKHKGTVSMAIALALENHKGGCGSQFFITLGDNIDYLDGRHAVFGRVLNEVFVDQDGRPHVVILNDPFPDPPGLSIPPSSPTRPPDNSTRITEGEDPFATLPDEEERIRREKAATTSALTLGMYAFIEYDKREDAEQAYFKMQNVLVDDRCLWVDFSQSVARLSPKRVIDKIRSGFAGHDDLEMTCTHANAYGMFDASHTESERRRKRIRSRDQDYSRERRRKRSKSPLLLRHKDSARDRDYDRERSRSRERRSDRDGR
ncbi:hypothetical protein BYT27DRAFT_7222239 [Phlegmacium glaucopus]|nr:hypothetical protein BYT27DRAFT_7222239 [Phlegmacium glaucopus]